MDEVGPDGKCFAHVVHDDSRVWRRMGALHQRKGTDCDISIQVLRIQAFDANKMFPCFAPLVRGKFQVTIGVLVSSLMWTVKPLS